MPAKSFTLCLAPSQHSRNVTCCYYFQRLGFILGWDGSIKVLLGAILSQYAGVPMMSSHQMHSSAIVKKLLSQQLIISMRLPIHIIATL